MKSFLLSSVGTRIIFSIVIALLIHVAVLTTFYLSSKDVWTWQSTTYERWDSWEKQKCEELWLRIDRQLDRSKCDIFTSATSSKDLITCWDRIDKLRPSLLREAENSTCPIETYSFPRDGQLPKLYPPKKPETWKAFVHRSQLDFAIGAAASIVTATLIYLAIQILRDAILIAHVGWRRLTLVLSAVAVLTGIILGVSHVNKNIYALGGIGAVSGLGFVALMTYGRRIAFWVSAGFGTSGKPIRVAESISMGSVEAAVCASTRQVTDEDPSDTSLGVTPQIESADQINQIIVLSPLSIELPRAIFWARLWARCIDLSIVWFLANIIDLFVPSVGSIIPSTAGIVVDAVISVIIVCGVLIFYDSWFLSKYGATPGKAIFGIRVISFRSRQLTWVESNARAIDQLKSGLYFMFFFPTLQILGAIAAWRRHDDQQPWDRQVGSVVVQKPINYVRYNATAMLAFILILSVVVIDGAAKSLLKQQRRGEFSQKL